MESIIYLGEPLCGTMQVNCEDTPYRNIKKSKAERKPSVETDKVVKIALMSLTINKRKGLEARQMGGFKEKSKTGNDWLMKAEG